MARAAVGPLPPTSPFLSVPELLTGEEPPVTWLIPDLLPEGSLITLAGAAGAGKSFLTYDLSICLATGTTIFGRAISPRRVLYFDQENSKADCTQYLRWAWKGLGRPPLDLLEQNLYIAHMQLGVPRWYERAAQLVTLVQPALIVIDTTTPSCNIEDENDNGEASQAINHLRRIMGLVTPVAACIALKHAKPVEKKVEGGARVSYTIRGAKAWAGAADATLFLLRQRGRPRGDGLNPTTLVADKVRAFGLRKPVSIIPAWVESGAGIALHFGSE